MGRWLVSMMVAAVLGPRVWAEPPALTASEVVGRHLEALGGRERIAAIRSLKKTGRYIYNGHEHPLVSLHKPGRRCREEIETLRLWAESTWPGHRVVRGTNGRVAWIEDESRPPDYRSISPARAALILEEADLQWALFEAETQGRQVELLGRGDVEGTPTHLLRVTVSPGLAIDWHLDLESFLASRTYWIKMSLVLLLVANGYAITRIEATLRPDAPQGWTALNLTSRLSYGLWFAIVLAGTILVLAA